jgi:tetratricopeptide (TPR) repeat protein
VSYGSRVKWLVRRLYFRGFPWTQRVEDDDLQAFLEVVIPRLYQLYEKGYELGDDPFGSDLAWEELAAYRRDAEHWQSEAEILRDERNDLEHELSLARKMVVEKEKELREEFQKTLNHYKQFDEAIDFFEKHIEATRVSPSRANLIKERHAGIYLKHEARRIKEEGHGIQEKSDD